MENHRSPPFLPFIGFLMLLALSLSHSILASGAEKDSDAVARKVYIIRLRPPVNLTSTDQPGGLEEWYRSFFPPATTSYKDSRLIYAYGEALTGFAARLTDAELDYIKKQEGFLRAWPDRLLPLATTHTPEFLGLQPGGGLWSDSNMGKGVIVCVVDTGITLGHPSFDDRGMEAPPSRWKGSCVSQGCNKKVIGARTFKKAFQGVSSPMFDDTGHGTHASATAAGNFVRNANVLGVGNGTAAGMAPRAHLAIYKVCSLFGCSVADVVAGIDAAIKDGVDVLSLSLGGKSQPFDYDPIAIGAFTAVSKGIFVSCAAGNSGPEGRTLSNEAPWILTVGASTMDRNIRVTVMLGDGRSFDGQTAYQPHQSNPAMHPLVLAGYNLSSGTLDDVKGKIVFFPWAGGSRIRIGEIVKKAGGAGLLVANDASKGYTTFAEAHTLPAAHLSYADGSRISSYMERTRNPKAAIIFKGTVLGVSPSPTVACFSSRGPSIASPLIMKPDIIGPGVNILAAWPIGVGPESWKNSGPNFNMDSGTSMSTPHLSGVAALIKQAHPSWSPAAIKSAMMTTSDFRDRAGKRIYDEQYKPAQFFSMGAGHINPSRAVDPGLVFDLSTSDYIPYLCGLGYKDEQVEHITHMSASCSGVKKIDGSELNYPSLSVKAASDSGEKTVQRTATNVGTAESTYRVKMEVVRGNFSVEVAPRRLRFHELGEKKRFTVRLKWEKKVGLGEANIKWMSGNYSVRIPLVIS